MMFNNVIEVSKANNIKESINKLKSSNSTFKLHKIWYQGLENLPSKYESCLKSWSTMYPQQCILLWNSISITTLLQVEYPNLIDIYNSFEMIQRIDLAKYMILNTFGGLYTDMDQECLKKLNIDSIMNDTEIVIATLTEKRLLICITSFFSFFDGPYLNNAFIISKPLASFWKFVFEEVNISFLKKYCMREIKIISTTGPLCISRACHNYGIEKLKILNSDLIDPMNLYFKLHYNVDERIVEYLCQKNRVICISTAKSSWRTEFNWYDKLLAAFVEYCYYEDLTKAIKSEYERIDVIV
jgi:hypothetical protein